MKIDESLSDVGIVVIGRNEGLRFIRCLQSLAGHITRLVYVDSGSTDGSVENARKAGAVVVELDPTLPFTAARARNIGIDTLTKLGNFNYVQFVDGDCDIDPGWIGAARQYLMEHPDVAVVSGRLSELFPERSVYNRLCSIEWNTPCGAVRSVGGIALFKIDDFLSVGKFDSSLIAGEEPELCMRIRQNKRIVMRIGIKMGNHDADLLSFSQWWQRTIRAGYGSFDVVKRFQGKMPVDEVPFFHIVRSVRIWTIYWAFATLLLALTGAVVSQFYGALGGLIVGFTIWIVQAFRIGWKVQSRAQDVKSAIAYGFFTQVGKWAQLLGQYKYLKYQHVVRSNVLLA